VRATENDEAEKLIRDSKLLEEAGCFALVLEKIPADLAKRVADTVSIPVIGIGAGSGVDGQVLVVHDMLGITKQFNPRFLRRYLNLYDEIKGAVQQYITDVKSVDFPNDKEKY
jgi:3-methyl-2-oxobutanoate hydroxymethyltransferase